VLAIAQHPEVLSVTYDLGRSFYSSTGGRTTLAPTVARTMRSHHEEATRHAAAEALLKDAFTLLAHEDDRTRCAAASAIEWLADPQVLATHEAALVNMLRDESSHVVKAAVDALALSKDFIVRNQHALTAVAASSKNAASADLKQKLSAVSAELPMMRSIGQVHDDVQALRAEMKEEVVSLKEGMAALEGKLDLVLAALQGLQPVPPPPKA